MDPAKYGYLHEDGTLKIVKWATNKGVVDNEQILGVDLSPRPVTMSHSEATGEGLVTNQIVGGDVIHVPAGKGFVPHTHPGHHLLVIIGGEGTITYDGKIYPTYAGEIYLIDGAVPHGVGAITDHVILACGASPHKTIDADERMEPVPYETVLSKTKNMTCLICTIEVSGDSYLHDRGCSHCPCYDCLGGDFVTNPHDH